VLQILCLLLIDRGKPGDKVHMLGRDGTGFVTNLVCSKQEHKDGYGNV
jgi:hypothetical protein